MKHIATSFPLALTAALTCGILLALTAAQTVFIQRQWNLEAQQNQQRLDARRLEEQRQEVVRLKASLEEAQQQVLEQQRRLEEQQRRLEEQRQKSPRRLERGYPYLC